MKEIKQFCYWHIATQENPEGTDCSAHLHEGRIFPCIYSIKDIKLKENGKMYLYIPGCPDFKLSEELEKRFEGLDEKSKFEALQKL